MLANSRTGENALYLASHASHIIGWPEDAGRALLDELMDYATEERFTYSHVWRAGDVVMRYNAARPHRIELIDHRPTTTLFLTGRKRREWGFYCRQGWRHWRNFTATDGRGGSRGCA